MLKKLNHTLRFYPDFWEKIKGLAKHHACTVTELIEKLINKELNRLKKRSK